MMTNSESPGSTMISTCHETEERDQEAAAYAHRLGLMVEPADSMGEEAPQVVISRDGRALSILPRSEVAHWLGAYESNLRHQNATLGG